MKAYQNQLERFRMIAKKLVDEQSADYFHQRHLMAGHPDKNSLDSFYSHLDALGKQLDEQAQHFIRRYSSARELGGQLKSEIWETCRQYLEQFVQRNQPSL